MYTVGIDAGSVTTKAMLLNGGDWRHVIRPACCNPSQAAWRPSRNCWAGLAWCAGRYLLRDLNRLRQDFYAIYRQGGNRDNMPRQWGAPHAGRG